MTDPKIVFLPTTDSKVVVVSEPATSVVIAPFQQVQQVAVPESASFASNALHANTADSATSASYALSASWAPGSGTANSASYALSASNALHANAADAATSAVSAISASYALTSSFAQTALTANAATSASYAPQAATSSYALAAGTVPFTGVTGTPAIVSSSSQVNYSGLAGIPVGIHSSSAQVSFAGISGVPSGLVSASGQVSYPALANIPTGIVSASGQVSYPALANIPVGIVSASAQVQFSGLSGVPSGLVSSSAQVNSGSFTGSFKGDGSALNGVVSASFATNALTANSASYALSASWAPGSGASISASYATTASFAQNALAANTATSASWVLTASFALTSAGTVINASTASYVDYSNVVNKPTLVSSSAQISYPALSNIPIGIHSSSAQVSYPQISNIPVGIVSSSQQINTGSFIATGSFTGSFKGDGSAVTGVVSSSYALSASWAPGSGASVSASYALTSSFAQNSLTANTSTTASYVDYGNVANKSVGLVSSSVQISYPNISNIPTGIVSSSGQVSYPGLANIPVGIVSSSQQINTGSFIATGSFTGSFVGSHTGDGSGLTGLPYANITGKPTLVSSSAQVSYTGLANVPTGIVSSSTQLPTGIVSASGQVSYPGLSNIPIGIVSSSGQVAFGGITGVPSGLVSASAQVSFPALSNIPIGIVSSSQQINTGSFIATGSFTGSFKGDGSAILNVVSASYALSASWSPPSTQATSASYAATASLLLGSVASAITAATASYLSGALDFPTGLSTPGPVTASGLLIASSSTFQGRLILSGALGGLGTGVRYIGHGGSATTLYLNGATGGEVDLAVGEVTQVRSSVANFTVNTPSTQISSSITINDGAGTTRWLRFLTSGVNRWGLIANTGAEAGSNAGSNLNISAYDDGGVFIDSPIQITRAAGGSLLLNRPTVITGSAALTGSFNMLGQFNNSSVGSNTIGYVSAQSGFIKGWLFRNNNTHRWLVAGDATTDAGAGANTGTNFIVSAYDDTGTVIDTPISILRGLGGLMTINRPTQTSGSNVIFGGAGTTRALWFYTGGSPRWAFYANGAVEAGSNAGTQLRLSAYDDSGVQIDTPLTVDRAAGGVFTVGRPTAISGSLTINGGSGNLSALLVQTSGGTVSRQWRVEAHPTLGNFRIGDDTSGGTRFQIDTSGNVSASLGLWVGNGLTVPGVIVTTNFAIDEVAGRIRSRNGLIDINVAGVQLMNMQGGYVAITGSLTTTNVITANSGSLLAEMPNPNSPSQGYAYLYAKNYSGRTMAKVMPTTGNDYSLQPSFISQYVQMVGTAGGTTLSATNTAPTSSGVISHPTTIQATGRMTNLATVAAISSSAFVNFNDPTVFRGTLGPPSASTGFFYRAKVAFPDSGSGAAGIRAFVGLNDTATWQLVTTNESASGNRVGFLFSTALPAGLQSTNFQLLSKDGTNQRITDTGIAFVTSSVYHFDLFAPYTGSVVYWTIYNKSTSVESSGTASLNLPTATTPLIAGLGLSTLGATAKNIRFQQIYLETDR